MLEKARGQYLAANGDIRNSNYEAFILAVSVLSVFNLALILLVFGGEQERLLVLVNTSLCLLFALDFLYRLWKAPSRWRYLFGGGGFLDLLSSIPYPLFAVARVLRVARAVRLLKGLGVRSLVAWFRERLAEGALLMVLTLVLLVLEGGGLAVLQAEADKPGANILTGSDALWWGVVTITSVGYGDCYPVTGSGRVVGVVMLTVGLGLIATVTGYIANTFLENSRKHRQDPPRDRPDER